jgi:hypothetical protein
MSENSSLVFHAFALITNNPGGTPGFKTLDLYDLNVMKGQFGTLSLCRVKQITDLRLNAINV